MDPIALALGVGALAGYNYYLRQTPQAHSVEEARPEHQLLAQRNIMLNLDRKEFVLDNPGGTVSSRHMLHHERDVGSMPDRWTDSEEFQKWMRSRTDNYHSNAGVDTLRINSMNKAEEMQWVYENEFLPMYHTAILPSVDANLYKNITADANKLSKMMSYHTGPKYVLATDRTPIMVNKKHGGARFMDKQNYFDDNPYTTDQVGIVDQPRITASGYGSRYADKVNAGDAPYSQPRRAWPTRVEVNGVASSRSGVPEFLPRVQPEQFNY